MQAPWIVKISCLLCLSEYQGQVSTKLFIKCLLFIITCPVVINWCCRWVILFIIQICSFISFFQNSFWFLTWITKHYANSMVFLNRTHNSKVQNVRIFWQPFVDFDFTVKPTKNPQSSNDAGKRFMT